MAKKHEALFRLITNGLMSGVEAAVVEIVKANIGELGIQSTVKRSKYVNAREAMEIIGINKEQFYDAVAAGRITQYEAPPRKTPMYSRQECERFNLQLFGVTDGKRRLPKGRTSEDSV